MVFRFYTRGYLTHLSEPAWVYRVTNLTKVVALDMQMLDRKPSEEPVITVEEEAIDYEA